MAAADRLDAGLADRAQRRTARPGREAEILEITGGSTDPTGWAGDTSDDGESELTDEAVDWIEAAANAESES